MNQKVSLLHRPRRLRRTESLRLMTQEHQLTINDLIYPLFVMEGEKIQQPISSMVGCYRYSLDLLLKEIEEVYNLGIKAIALFPYVEDDKKDNEGKETYNPDGLVQSVTSTIK